MNAEIGTYPYVTPYSLIEIVGAVVLTISAQSQLKQN